MLILVMLVIKCTNSYRLHFQDGCLGGRVYLIFILLTHHQFSSTPLHTNVHTKPRRGGLITTCCHHASHASLEKILPCRCEIEASLDTTVKSAGICFLDLSEQLSRTRRKAPWLHFGTREACTRTSAIRFSFES